ncbi:MAG: TetR/AcrR family transcriptional regulator [Elusimicrobiota bacterium]
MKRLTQKEREEKKKQILLEAQKIIMENNEDFTVDALVKSLGWAKGTFFLYYRSKDELLADVLGQFLGKLKVELKKNLHFEKPTNITLYETIYILLDYFKEKRKILSYFEKQDLNISIKKKFKKNFADIISILVSIINKAKKKEKLEIQDSFFLASIFFGMCRGSNVYENSKRNKLSLNEKANIISKMFIKGLRSDK